MANADTKSRIINIYRLLLAETDAEHYLTVNQIIDWLEAKGISAYRKTVIADIEQLIESGIDIKCIKSTQNRYYMNSGLFSIAELKLLVDAVEAAQFITEKKSEALIEKLSSLTSTHNSEKLCRTIVLAQRAKSDNEEIFENIDRCHEAINRNKQLTFLYFEYNEDKQRILRNYGEEYRLSPYCLTWEDAKYYVIGYSLKHEKIITIRVDRMNNVVITDDMRIPAPEGFNAADYVNKVFRMFDDKMVKVTLKCRNDLMKVVIDRFGLDVETEPKRNGYFYAKVEVSVSRTFYGWVFQFDGGIDIVKPPRIRKEYMEMGKRIFGNEEEK